MSAAPPPMGHNIGTPAELVRDELATALQVRDARRDELVGSEARCVITDNDAVGRAGDLAAMITRLADDIDDRYREVILPYDQAIGAARGTKERWLVTLLQAEQSLRAKISTFRQQQRDKAAEARRKQREEEAALRMKNAPSAAPPPEPEPERPIALPAVVGDYGSRVSDRKVDVFSWKDPRKVDRKVLDHPKVAEAMQIACRDVYKIQKKITGVTVEQVAATTLRK